MPKSKKLNKTKKGKKRSRINKTSSDKKHLSHFQSNIENIDIKTHIYIIYSSICTK